jgi:hypothetical protein
VALWRRVPKRFGSFRDAPRRGANSHDGRLCEIHGCALAEDPTPNSASARIYRPDRAPSRYAVDAVRSAWGDARWRRWSRSAEPRSACGRSPLPTSRQAPTSSHRGTANPVVENSPRDSQTLPLVARKGAGASCPRCQFSRQSTRCGLVPSPAPRRSANWQSPFCHARAPPKPPIRRSPLVIRHEIGGSAKRVI